MADLLKLVKSGVDKWNAWRTSNPRAPVDLSRVALRDANLNEYDLSSAHLHKADLQGASLWKTNLDGADLTQANLRGSNLRCASLKDAVAVRTNISRAVCWKADFRNANLYMADFWGTDLSEVNLSNVALREARLHGAILVRADLRNADLSRSMVYGSSAWDANLEGATQRDLVITPDAGRQKWHGYDRMELAGPVMTVDDLEVAQFLYLLVNNAKIRRVIDTITSKLVLLLGRFTPERKAVLDSLRDALRQNDLVPVLFDFEKPSTRDFTETVATIGHLSRLVIADLTDPRSVPQELQRLIPSLPSVPVQPIIQEEQSPYSMFPDFGGYLSVLPPLRYRDAMHLCELLQPNILRPAAARSVEIAARRANFSAGLLL
jgi:uncharacterized protein YjbI with pentapeptide repeats